MLEVIGNIRKIPDLRNRILFTLGILLIFQLAAHVTVPGVNVAALREYMGQQGGRSLFGMIDLFTGGGFKRLSIIALGIMPYITASILIQLLTVVWPYLEELSKRGDEGRKKITQYTRYGTVLITLFQAGMLAFNLAGAEAPGGAPLIVFSRWPFILSTMLAVTTGTIFLMWLGEQITERGIGNGISLIIFAGIVGRFPSAVGTMINYLQIGETVTPFRAIIIVAMMVGVIAAIVVMTYAQRRITIRRGKQVVGRKVYGGNTSYLPIRVNTAGVIPVIFAASIMIFPLQILQWLSGIQYQEWDPGFWHSTFEIMMPVFEWLSRQMGMGAFGYNLLYVLLIIFFCYFYTSITFNPKDLAENLQRYGSTIPGYSQGKRTEQYITYIIERVTLAGGIMLAVISVIPNIVYGGWGVNPGITDFLGGTGLIIVVGVALDTVNQIENHLRMRNYDTFRKRGKVKGRRFS